MDPSGNFRASPDSFDAPPADPDVRTRRRRANALSRRARTTEVAADGYLIQSLAESCLYDPESGELNFRARKSSSTSVGSNRDSWAERDQFASELQAKRASLLSLGTVQEVPQYLHSSEQKNKNSSEPCARMHREEKTVRTPQQHSSEGFNSDLNNSHPLTCHRDFDEDSIQEIFPHLAGDTTSNSQAMLVIDSGSYTDEQRNKEFIEKYTGAKSILMNMPELNLLLQNEGEVVIESSPFTFKIDRGEHGYQLKIIVPVGASSIAVALVIIRGNHDDAIAWPFPDAAVIFQLQDLGEKVTIEEKGFQCRKEDNNIKKSLVQPRTRQNQPFGLLDFVSKDCLRDKMEDNSVYSLTCLILPHFPVSVMGGDLRQPSLVPVKSKRKQHICIETPHVPTESSLPPYQAHASSCSGQCFPPGEPEQMKFLGYPVRCNLPIILDKYGISESLRIHTGSTLVTMEIADVKSILRSEDPRMFSRELSFRIQSATRHELSYKAKVICRATSDHLSLGLVIVKGEHDSKLQWPFDMSVILGLMNVDSNLNRERGFRCYGNGLQFSGSLGRPKTCENLPIGISHFIPKQALRNGFILGDSLSIKCLLLHRSFLLPPSMKEYPSVLL